MPSRAATELETLINVDRIGEAMGAAKARVEAVLLEARAGLIDEALSDLEALDAASYHLISIGESLTLAPLILALQSVFEKGRELVVAELAKQGAAASLSAPAAAPAIEQLASITASRLINDVAYRAADSAISLALIEPDESKLLPRVAAELEDGSTAYVSSAAAGVVHVALREGREWEAEAQSEHWSECHYSSVLDKNSCLACSNADGETGASLDDVTPAPNPDCEGGSQCRCVHVFVVK